MKIQQRNALQETLSAIQTKLVAAQSFLESGDGKLVICYLKEINALSTVVPGDYGYKKE